MLDQNWIRDFFRSIGYPIGAPSKLYEDNQAKIERVMADIITPQDRPIDVKITALHELHLRFKKKYWTQYQTCNLTTSILSLMVEKVSKISLIVPQEPASIIPQYQWTINFFAWTSFMDQPTSIVRKIRKVTLKDKNIQCTQSYYETLRISHLKILHILSIFYL